MTTRTEGPNQRPYAEAFDFEGWLKDGMDGMKAKFEYNFAQNREQFEEAGQNFKDAAEDLRQKGYEFQRSGLLNMRSALDDLIYRLDQWNTK